MSLMIDLLIFAMQAKLCHCAGREDCLGCVPWMNGQVVMQIFAHLNGHTSHTQFCFKLYNHDCM